MVKTNWKPSVFEFNIDGEPFSESPEFSSIELDLVHYK